MEPTQEIFSRTERLLGPAGMQRLRKSRVAIFGVGGVGGYVAEALARCGVGTLDLVDHDRVSLSNLNRQILALHSTVGRKKVAVMAERIADICPETIVNACDVFYLPETAAQFDFHAYDFVVDAIDTVAGKVELILQAQAADTPILCAMGAGNKTDPSAFRIADLAETKVCPLAKALRIALRKHQVEHVRVVYSEEVPLVPFPSIEGERVPGSLAFVPSVVGLLMAGEVVRTLCGVDLDSRRKNWRDPAGKESGRIK